MAENAKERYCSNSISEVFLGAYTRIFEHPDIHTSDVAMKRAQILIIFESDRTDTTRKNMAMVTSKDNDDLENNLKVVISSPVSRSAIDQSVKVLQNKLGIYDTEGEFTCAIRNTDERRPLRRGRIRLTCNECGRKEHMVEIIVTGLPLPQPNHVQD